MYVCITLHKKDHNSPSHASPIFFALGHPLALLESNLLNHPTLQCVMKQNSTYM